MNTPLITIIIPIYKVEQYLHRCVDSVLHQTYTNLKIILVDDGSPDACPLICDEYATKDSRVTVIHKENGGQSSARNAALDSHPDGDFLFFLDSDDYLHLQTLEILLKIQQESDADMVQIKFLHGSANVFPDIPLHYQYNTYNNTTIFYSSEMSLCVCGGLYKMSIWDDIRMPLGTVNEDDATSWQAYYKCGKIAISSLPLYYYFKNQDSTMARLKKELRLDFIGHYHKRILFFREKDMKLLTRLSQWRFCLPLMMSYVSNKAATESQRSIMWKEFKANIKPVLMCSKVPFTHKILFILFRLLPNICRFLAMKFGVKGK